MTRWRDFAALSDRFRAAFVGGAPAESRPVSWQGLVDAARAHWAVPTLSWCLREEPALPADLRGYLDAVLRLNGKRTERLRDALAEIVGALNVIGVEPVLLKGSAHLVTTLYPSPGARLMSDLDILVPAERGPDAVAAMERIGYYVDQILPDWHRHLPQMRHADTDIVLELHTRILPEEIEVIAPTTDVVARSQPVAFGGLRARVPDPTTLVAHNVAHDQIVDKNYRAGFVELRQLLDLVLIRARHGAEIDWPELDRRFRQARTGRVLATYLRYAEALFGQPTPPLTIGARPFAMARLRLMRSDPVAVREVRQLRRERSLRRMGTLARESLRSAAHVAMNPRRLLRLADPRAWVRQVRALRRAVKETL